MDKRVVLSVAGSGKTSNIINRIERDSRSLIVTYTENNTKHLKNRIINKFGEIPKGIRIYSYFTFLYSFCYRPLLDYGVNAKGINFDYPLPNYAKRTTKDSIEHYQDKNHRLYASRISKLLIETNTVCEVIQRIEHFFDLVCIDEVQDFAANDFNLLCKLAKTNTELLLVGDFYQHTFDTSKDGNTQKSLHISFQKYCKKLTDAGFTIDLNSLSHSYRCSPTVCEFVEKYLGIKIKSHRNDEVTVSFVRDSDEIAKIFLDDSIVKLFYNNSKLYPGNTGNWGKTKGLDHFQDVCVVLNPSTLKAYLSGNLEDIAATTKNKLYVACTRAKGNLYFIPESTLKLYKKS